MVVICLYLHDENHYWLLAGIVLFIAAGILDKLDGYIARRFNQVTDFGILWDPMIDKIWLHSIGLALALLGYVPMLCIWLFLMRDLMVTQLRSDHPGDASFKRADKSGKLKFRWQAIFLGSSMLRPDLNMLATSSIRLGSVLCALGFVVAAYYTIRSWTEYLGKYAS